MSGHGDRRRGRPSPPPSDSSDEDTVTHIQCWIPAANIDLVVLATYLKEFVDDTATIRPASNPQVDHTNKSHILLLMVHRILPNQDIRLVRGTPSVL
jgi:hypothetical protein